MIQISKIHFEELRNLNDNNSIVLAGITVDDMDSDLLLHLTEEGDINPLVRLGMRQGGLSVLWTSDFINNYASDYAES